MKSINVDVTLDEHARELGLPRYMSDGASGVDLLAAVDEDVAIEPGKVKLIPTGMRIALPHGYEAQVRPRSGLALKHGIALVNSPGTIDADYRGEIKVVLINLGEADFEIHHGDRIAQLVVAPVSRVEWQQVTELDTTSRNAGGFGHTGGVQGQH